MLKSISKKNTLIILDWDDTLFPTSWMKNNDMMINNNIDISSEHRNIIKILDNRLYTLLNTCLKYGDPIIVTNAMTLWITKSSNILPKTSIVLNRIKVFSAREIALNRNKNEQLENWKKYTFRLLYNGNYKNYNNIISIGDAIYEYEALVNIGVSDNSGRKIYKTVKLLDEPTIYELCEQLSVLTNKMQSVCNNKNNLDLNFKNV